MKTATIACATLAALSFLIGCGGEGAGFLIRPVPADQTLRESVVQQDGKYTSDKVAIVDVEGMLINARASSMFMGPGDNPVSVFIEKLDMAANDSKVKAVLLRINSPGGTVQASEAMYDALLRFRKKTNKPVVSYIQDLGASGAYYVACGTPTIYCQSTSLTGSIGVIMQTVSFAGTMAKLGITADAITSGPHKDMGSPLKDLKPEDRKILQDMVNEFYGKFVTVVCDGRKKLTREKVTELADGRVYTGKQAAELGLVDKVCDIQDAIAAAKTAAGVKAAKVVMYARPLGYRANVYSAAPTDTGTAGAGGPAPTAAPQINLINIQAAELTSLRRPTFLYLWTTEVP